LGGELGKDTRVVLAGRLGAHGDIHVAAGIHAHCGGIEGRHARHAAFAVIRRSSTRVLNKARHANTEVLLVGARLGLALAQPAVIGQTHHPLQGLHVVAAIIQAACGRGVREFVGLDKVPAPDVHWIEPQTLGNHVHDAFDNEDPLDRAHAAVRALRAFIREQAIGLTVVPGNAIRTED
jgi:hypothetical protein